MERTYSQIDMDERRKIARWTTAGNSATVIAEKLGRHRSTIFKRSARYGKPKPTALPPLQQGLREPRLGAEGLELAQRAQRAAVVDGGQVEDDGVGDRHRNDERLGFAGAAA